MTFSQVLSAALKDLSENGFDNVERIQRWIRELRRAAETDLAPLDIVEQDLNATYRRIYKRLIEEGGIAKFHPGVSRFTIDRLKPKMHSELERRVVASANLIKLNRDSAIEKTTQRFFGIASSIPAGGTKAINKGEEAKTIRKAFSSLPFEERRVAIDQGHKFISSLNSIIATEGGAIAAVWESHWRRSGYNYRHSHKERDGVVYVIRGNWAMERGLMKLAGHQYTDQITQPGEEIFCRCNYHYIYDIESLPSDMITEKGREEIRRIRAKLS